MQPQKLLGILPPFTGKKILVINDQDTSDIIQEMKKAHKIYAADYDKISSFFWKGNVYLTCKFLWNYLKTHVKYSIEPESRQSVKSPAAIISTGIYNNGMNDCKHYSLFAGGVLDSLKRKGKKINWVFRFANYKLFQKTPHHVFIVVFDNNKEIWIDPVLSNFNEKKSYINKIDKMPLYSISGIGCQDCNKISGRGRVKRKARKAANKAAGYCKGKFAKRVILAPARNAFLSFVGLNIKRSAIRLYNTLQNPTKKARLFSKWCKLGGDAKKLENTILRAYKKYARKRGISGIYEQDMIGAPITAVIAAAAPIIKALSEFLGKASELRQNVQSLTSRNIGPDEIPVAEETPQDESDGIGFTNSIWYY